LERLEHVFALAVQPDMHDDRHAEPDGIAVDARLIALDDAILFERADAPGNRRRRQGDALGKLDLAQPAVLEQRSEDGAIQRVEFPFGHFPAPNSQFAQKYCANIPFYTVECQQSLPDSWHLPAIEEAPAAIGGHHAHWRSDRDQMQ